MIERDWYSHLMKFGCACIRSVLSTDHATCRNAVGCVVWLSAMSSCLRSRAERFSCLGASSITYVAITRSISSRKGWIVTFLFLISTQCFCMCVYVQAASVSCHLQGALVPAEANASLA